jgi:hypothetical protein
MPRVIEDRIRRQAFCSNSLLDYAAIDSLLWGLSWCRDELARAWVGNGKRDQVATPDFGITLRTIAEFKIFHSLRRGSGRSFGLDGGQALADGFPLRSTRVGVQAAAANRPQSAGRNVFQPAWQKRVRKQAHQYLPAVAVVPIPEWDCRIRHRLRIDSFPDQRSSRSPSPAPAGREIATTNRS